MFTWDTDSSACGTNDEWWTSRHDEWGHGRLRHRHTAARHAALPRDHREQRLERNAPVDRAGRRLALRHRRQVPGDQLEQPDRAPDGRRPSSGTSAPRRPARRRPDHLHARAPTGSSPSSTRTRTGTGATWRPRPSPSHGRAARLRCAPRWCRPTRPARARTAPTARRSSTPSCNPPAQSSGTLTVGTLDANGFPAQSVALGAARRRPGDTATTANEADVGVDVEAHRRPLPRDERRLPGWPGLRLHREGAGGREAEDHRQVQRLIAVRGWNDRGHRLRGAGRPARPRPLRRSEPSARSARRSTP